MRALKADARLKQLENSLARALNSNFLAGLDHLISQPRWKLPSRNTCMYQGHCQGAKVTDLIIQAQADILFSARVLFIVQTEQDMYHRVSREPCVGKDFI